MKRCRIFVGLGLLALLCGCIYYISLRFIRIQPQTIAIIEFDSKVISDAEVLDVINAFREGLSNTGIFDVVDKDAMPNIDKTTAGEVTIAYSNRYSIYANIKDVKTGRIVAMEQIFVNNKNEFAEKAKQLAILLADQVKPKIWQIWNKFRTSPPNKPDAGDGR